MHRAVAFMTVFSLSALATEQEKTASFFLNDAQGKHVCAFQEKVVPKPDGSTEIVRWYGRSLTEKAERTERALALELRSLEYANTFYRKPDGTETLVREERYDNKQRYEVRFSAAFNRHIGYGRWLFTRELGGKSWDVTGNATLVDVFQENDKFVVTSRMAQPFLNEGTLVTKIWHRVFTLDKGQLAMTMDPDLYRVDPATRELKEKLQDNPTLSFAEELCKTSPIPADLPRP